MLVVYNWGVLEHFGVLGHFSFKKTYMEIQQSLLNYANSSRSNFNEKCPNTPKCSDILGLCTTLLKMYNPVHFVINTFTLGQQTID